MVSTALVGDRVLPLIFGRDCELLTYLERLRKNHRELRIVILVFLNECLWLAIRCGHAPNTQCPEEIEGHNA
jgi:hypothetical protein